MARRLLVRANSTSPWIENFSKLGWKVNPSDQPAGAKNWVHMKPTNTLLRTEYGWECVK